MKYRYAISWYFIILQQNTDHPLCETAQKNIPSLNALLVLIFAI